MQGKTIYGYTLQQQLGKGGMAEVWLAENEIGKLAAVKLLLPKFSNDDAVVARFKNEAKVMVKLDHTNIRQVYDYGEIDGRPSIVMEYLEGDDLKSLMKNGKQFSDIELRVWWNQIADALNYTHAQGIVHRDIKPSNIFLDKKGNIKLLDFGIAKIKEGISMTQTGAMMGTLMYMSPEQVDDAKHLGPASDVYSLAVTFIHLLTGKAPYDTATMSDFKIRESIVYKPLDMTGVPVEWQAFLMPYLEKDPEKRSSLKEFARQQTENREDLPKRNVIENILPQEKEDEETLLEGMGCTSKVKTDTISDDLELTINGVSFVMKYVEGGFFWMGADNGERIRTITVKTGSFMKEKKQEKYVDENVRNYDVVAQEDEKPVHRVTLDSFYIGETEVTQALWEAVMGNNPSRFKGNNYPVVNVSYNDIVNVFLPKLNQITGMNFRLPTEAKWEFAARGGNKTNGYKYAGSSSIDAVAWYRKNSGGKIHTVKSKASNELGLYDMSGNVWEWCSDFYGNYDRNSQINLQESLSGSNRVLRGGSWLGSASFCRVSNRSNGDPGGRYSLNGFRLCLPR